MPPKKSIEWERLQKIAEKIGYGEMRVVLQNGKPVRVDTAIKQIKLDAPEDFAQGLDTLNF